jgi:hypothetical protein
MEKQTYVEMSRVEKATKRIERNRCKAEQNESAGVSTSVVSAPSSVAGPVHVADVAGALDTTSKEAPYPSGLAHSQWVRRQGVPATQQLDPIGPALRMSKFSYFE